MHGNTRAFALPNSRHPCCMRLPSPLLPRAVTRSHPPASRPHLSSSNISTLPQSAFVEHLFGCFTIAALHCLSTPCIICILLIFPSNRSARGPRQVPLSLAREPSSPPPSPIPESGPSVALSSLTSLRRFLFPESQGASSHVRHGATAPTATAALQVDL
jgi:hypothetical protein